MRVALIALCLLATAVPAQAATLRICTTEWPPFTVGEAGGAVGGVHTAVVTEAFRRLGAAVRIDSAGWDRCWKEAESGSYDAIYSASYRPERARVAVYPKTPLQSLSYVAVVRRGTGAAWTGRDVRQLPQPVAAPRGYSITGELQAVLGDSVDDGALRDIQDVQKLLSGRVGTAVVEATVAAVLIRQMGIADKVEVLAPPVNPRKDYFVVVSRSFGASDRAAQLLADRLDGVLAELAREGMVERLLSQEGLAAGAGP